MKLLISPIFALSVALSIVGCKPAAGGPRGKVIEYEKGPFRAQDGGADTGGGAGANGRMLEHYRVRIMETPEYITHVQPIIDAVAEIDPHFAADLTHIATQRQWYIIPTDLAKIPPSDMVATIAGERVEQIAVQTEAEVWIDKRIYATMPSLERRELIVHELVMGVRLMEYQGKYDQCLAVAAVQNILKNPGGYRERKRDCALKRLSDTTGEYRLTRRQVRLSTEDYNVVRNITIQLLGGAQQLSREELRILAEIELKRAPHRPPG